MEVDGRLRDIYDTFDIEEDKVQLTRHGFMYHGLQTKKMSSVIPLHKALYDSILKECENSERKLLFIFILYSLDFYF